MVPLTTLSYQGWIRYPCFCSLKLFAFLCGGFTEKLTCVFLVYEGATEKLTDIKTFRVRKTTVSSTFLIRLRFQLVPLSIGRCHLCAWRVTWNYTYSPFKYQDISIFLFQSESGNCISHRFFPRCIYFGKIRKYHAIRQKFSFGWIFIIYHRLFK